jgi:hypothetical protein
VLSSIAATDATISVTPSVITKDTPEVTVNVTVPVNSNSWVFPVFFKDKSISSSMTLRRERFETSSVP